ncbi:MAG: radical SAM protein [bacterium]|nr:radical SAM protein [bacterium]
METNQKKSCPGEKILLALLPFWDPQIPPLGIACLKSYLQQRGHKVKTVDVNLEMGFREIYDDYFALLANYIPQTRQGNLFNIGNQVIRNHLTAHLNYTVEEEYRELVKILVYKTFYFHLEEEPLTRLIEIVANFYSLLQEYMEGLLDREKPTVLGLSVYSGTMGASLFTFKLAKERVPGIKTIMGGGIFSDQLAPGAPNLDEFVEETASFIDKIVVGEGEELMLRFMEGDLPNSQRVFGIKDLRSKTLDMSTTRVPDFSDFSLSHYPHLAHYGSRSCPFQCRFCSETVNWGKYRKKQIKKVVDEMTELATRHSYQLFLMTDSLLNPVVTPLANEMIERDVSLYWDGFLRADKHVASRENTLLWRRGGFYRAKLGLESGSPNVLKLMQKEISIEQIKAAVTSLAYAGIKTTTFWLFGFPGETEEDFCMTLDLIEELKDYIYEADCNAFNYYLTGQANSEEWRRNNKGVLLYPEWAADMLLSQTWHLAGEPSREEVYSRVNRFVEHCGRLGVPNPYSLKDICKADERWKQLHKNAVPSVVEFRNQEKKIDESKYVKDLTFARSTLQDDDEWL